MAFTSLVVVLINAWMGARVVYSGLKPGVLTTHLALAMLLTGTLMYCAWRGTDRPWRVEMNESWLTTTRQAVLLLLITVIGSGILGAQVREMTDEMAKFHDNAPRETWITELEQSWLYLAHRSFSWVVFAAAVWAWWLTRRHRRGGAGPVEHGVMAIVLAQMVLGFIMARIHIYSWVQVLHVGLAAVLLSLVWLWLFGLRRATV
jgi:cytochrome c oxidase assembly protein subunit 15